MPTLTEYYEEVDAKQSTLRVVIAGITVSRVQSASWQFAIGQVPSASIRIKNPPAAHMAYFADVYIESGFNGVVKREFTGKVMHVNPDEGGCNIECVGKSWPLDFHWHKVIYTFAGVTAQAAVTALLTQAGITAFVVNLPAWTIGTVCEQTLEFQTYGEAISKVAEVDGGRWYETPDGTVHVEVCDQIPALNAWRTYFSMMLTGIAEGYPVGLAAPARPRLRNVKVDQEIREAKNQAFVRGCTYTQTNADGTEDSIDVEGTAMAPSPWILTPSGGQAYNDILFSNELIDTPAKAASVAVRLVTTLNRLLTRIGVTIDGDPQVFLRGTVGIEDPAYSRVTGRWFTESYRTTIDERDFVTTLDLRGGAEAGSHITVCPFALFNHVGDLEVVGTKQWAIVTFDASGSVDPDGGTLTYLWSDNQGVVAGTDPVMTFRIDPTAIVGSWEVTLTVTDADGCSDSITLTIPVTPGSQDMYIPALMVAFDQWFSGSPDGGISWNDQAAPAGDPPVFISAGLKIVTDGMTFGVGWAGTSAGAIYKTTDYCASAPVLVMPAIGSPIEHIWPDMNWPPDAWAVTRDGRVYRSQDDGDTWNLYDDLKLVFNLPNLRLSRVATPAPDGVWVFGGEGVAPGPLIAFDPTRTHAWAKAALGGELTGDLGGGVAVDLQMAEGTYVGDGAVSKPIVGLGFQPKVVVVKGDTATDGHAVIRTDTMSKSRPVTNISQAWGIKSLDMNGFTVGYLVGDSAHTNALGVTYYWYAFGGTSVKTGTYVGDGAADHDIPGIGFLPVMAWTMPDPDAGIVSAVLFRTTDMGAKSLDFSFSLGQIDEIITLDPDGFSVGSRASANNVLKTYHYVAFKASSNLHIGTYPGNGVDNRNLPVVPMSFDPDVVCTKGELGQEAIFRVTAMAVLGDASFQYGSVAHLDNRLQSLIPAAGQFQIGNDVDINANGFTYYFFAFKAAAGGIPAPADIYVREAASREAGELAIILDSDSHIPAVYYTWDILGAGDEWTRCLNCPDKPHGRWIAPDFEFGLFCFAFNDNINYRGDVDPATGVMTATVAPGQLGAGYEAEHGVWIGALIGGMAGCYIVAALDGAGAVDGFLYKTWDRFETNPVELLRPAAGFDACEPGSRGYMVAFEGQGSPNPNYVGEPWAQVEADDKALLSLLGNAWTEESTDAGDENWHLRNLNGNLYRIANAMTWGNIGGPGDLERSDDGGATWTAVIAKDAGNTRGVVAVTIGPDGSLWALWGSHSDNGQSLKVYKSTDDGVTWGAAVYADVGTAATCLFPIDIAVHPSDKDILAITSIHGTNGATLTVLNFLTSTFADHTMAVTTNGTEGLWLVFGDGNRIIVAGGGTIIQTTDDYGTAWATKDNPAGTSSRWIIRVSLTRLIYGISQAANNGGSIRISEDNGQTWIEYIHGSEIDPSLDTEDMWTAAIDSNGALCIAFNAVLNSDLLIWRRANPWAPSPPDWVDITYDADDLTGGRVSLQGLAARTEIP